MIPDPRRLSSSIKKKLEAALKEMSRRPVYSVFEEIKCNDRRRLDALALEANWLQPKIRARRGVG